MHLISSVLLLACLGVGGVRGNAQVILNPNQISGTIRFSNTNTAILSLLDAPGHEGMSNILVQANSLPPAPPITASTGYLPVASRTNGDYEITVDSDTTGISYSVRPVVLMQDDKFVYYFSNQVSAPVAIGVTPPPLDFEECVGVVTVQFVTSGGAPVAVDGGFINAYNLPEQSYSGQRSGIPTGVTEQRIYLRGGQTHRLDITVNRGTNFYTDRIESFLMTNVVVTCDDFTTVAMVIPDAVTLATITGDVDMLGEFEITAAGNLALDAADYTAVITKFGPFGNQRWDALTGTNFTAPSSGPFLLTNVVPSTLEPASPGYMVFAQMAFRTNRSIEVFYTPALNAGANAPLPVSEGASVNLSNLFVINPGYLRGGIRLQGPAESLGQTSLLRGLLHAGDDDGNGDGIPDGFGTYGIYNSTVQAVGVDRLASDATFTAASGLGYGDFPGEFNPTTSTYEGQYELVLGGLNGERSVWKQKHLTLVLSSGTVTNDNDYFYNALTVTEQTTNDVEIIPTQAATNDVAYCLSEVKVVFRTTSGTFYSPSFRTSSGTFTGTDFLGQPANYSVAVGPMYGSPFTEATATNIGQVIMYLPEGTYTLYPSVFASGGSETGLQPIDVTVGCGERIALEPCLQLILNAPDCTNSPSVQITGSVLSCTNEVASIAYTLNGGAAQTICTDCGTDPTFAFTLDLAEECTNNILTVTATNDVGGVSSVTTAVHYDGTPPDITCPADIVVTNSNGAVVNFAVAATDNCASAVNVVSTPPSGSIFPLGTNTVTSVATDACGNTSSCSFNVIMVPDCLRLTITPPVCTTNYGFLASANVDACEETLTNLSLSANSLVNTNIRLGYSDIRILIGARTNLTTAHGLFPEFDAQPLSFYTDILYTATARDNKGRVAIVQFVAHYDFTPPVITCPSDIIVTATNGTSAVVNYAATTDDGCSCPVITSYFPPSGSSFAIGTHTVTVRAHDLCHNTNTCTFQVIVLPPECSLHIELSQLSPPQVTLTWDCDAKLQSAPELTGSWADIDGATSPFVTDASAPQTFYRLRYSSGGTALQFPGTSSAYTSTPFPNIFGSGPALTITAWLKTSQSTGAYPGIVTKYLGNSAQGYGLALNAGRLAPWYYYNATQFVEPGFSGPADRFIADGLWHHVAFVVNTNSGRTFIDGQLVNTQPWTGSPFYAQSSEPLRFGYYPEGAGKLFIGEMDEVTLWSVALTDGEISSLMSTPPLGAEPSLQGYWRFDEAGGGTAFDWTGHGYNAVLGSGVSWTTSTAPIFH